MPKIDNKIIIGYSNFEIFFYFTYCCEENNTKKHEPIIKSFTKLEKASFINVFENIFTVSRLEFSINIDVIISIKNDSFEIK